MDDLLTINPVEFFRGIPLFTELADDDLQELLREMETVYLQAGQKVFSEGDPPKGMYVIERGELSVTVRTGTGRSVLLAHLGNGSVIGEMSLISGKPRSATVNVLAQTLGHYLAADKFSALRKRQSGLAHKIILQLARTLDERRLQLEEQIQELRENPVIEAHLLRKEAKELIARVRKG